MSASSTSGAHVAPLSLYFTIFGLLMLGTILTVAAAAVDMGALNTPIALAIAITKATLVLLYFMHLRYSPFLTISAVVAAFTWMVLMIVVTMSDFVTRPLETWMVP